MIDGHFEDIDAVLDRFRRWLEAARDEAETWQGRTRTPSRQGP